MTVLTSWIENSEVISMDIFSCITSWLGSNEVISMDISSCPYIMDKKQWSHFHGYSLFSSLLTCWVGAGRGISPYIPTTQGGLGLGQVRYTGRFLLLHFLHTHFPIMAHFFSPVSRSEPLRVRTASGRAAVGTWGQWHKGTDTDNSHKNPVKPMESPGTGNCHQKSAFPPQAAGWEVCKPLCPLWQSHPPAGCRHLRAPCQAGTFPCQSQTAEERSTRGSVLFHSPSESPRAHCSSKQHSKQAGCSKRDIVEHNEFSLQ